MAVMPSDHLIADRDGFHQSTRIAVDAATAGALVTFGIQPNTPETGFGYIETGEEVSPGVREAVRFVEKPNLETAKNYLAAGNFVWNSGMFFFTAEKILDEIGKQMPDLKVGLDKIDMALKNGNEAEVLDTVFPGLPSESIDYGIMENAGNILCVPVDFGWSDLGSWAAAFELSSKDENRNALTGDTVSVDSDNCLVRTPEGKLVALVGVHDLVVVDTGAALLVCRKDQDQHVKKVVETLKSSGRSDLL